MSTATRASVIGKDEAEEQLSDMVGDFDEMLRRSAEAQRQMGLMYNHAVNNKLAQQAGYKNAWDYLGRHVKGLTKLTLERYGVENLLWSAEVTLKYGYDRLYALDHYIWRRGVTAPSGDPGRMLIRVPQWDGTDAMKTFADCNLEELRRAARNRRSKPKPRVPVTDEVRWLYLDHSIHESYQELASVRTDMRYEDGKVLVTLKDVPLRAMEQLIKAIRMGLDAQPFVLRDETNGSA
jgi:hypothetical protein